MKKVIVVLILGYVLWAGFPIIRGWAYRFEQRIEKPARHMAAHQMLMEERERGHGTLQWPTESGGQELKPMSPFDNDRPISVIPNGVYGYTVPWIVPGIEPGPGVVASGTDPRISCRPGGTVQLEVQKRQNGSVYIAGRVSEEDAQLLRDGVPCTVTLWMPEGASSWGYEPPASLTLVDMAIPTSRLSGAIHRTIMNCYVVDCTILAS